MEYLALYRKYRPSELDDVVGQTEIKQILASSIKNGTITHAYLFSGPRGTGKTTMAKILSKMVNCEEPVDGNPCNKCNSCLNLFSGNDIIEIDAASNNGVDEIRDLREKANLVPSMCKYKVYIIDEVHMLTTQAFNALLKTLEEPPKHVIFILATTEYHKIPLTITSRCQKFQFNKISIEGIVSRLKKIAELENINIDDESLVEIAKISDGGMRDSINFLDQLRSFTSNKISINDVYDVCGNVSSQEILNLFVNIKNNDFEKVTLFFENMNANGKNYSKFFEDITFLLKDVILYKNNVSRELIKSNELVIREIGNLYTLNDIFYMIDIVNNLMDKIRYVSRQSVVVISNFLLIMSHFNENSDNANEIIIPKIDANSDLINTNLTSNNKVNSQINVEKELVVDNKNIENIIEKYDKNKEIIINNAFATANKQLKSNLQNNWSKVSDYLTDSKYAQIAGILIDTSVEVVGEGYIILSVDYDSIVDKVYNNYKLCEELINIISLGKYNLVVINRDEWGRYRDEYILNVRNGKKYEVMPIYNNKIILGDEKKEPTIVDKLFDIVGEDYIEFK